MMLPSENFWSGRNVLVTGHTGFKGSWLVMLLDLLRSNVSGFSLPSAGGPSLFADAGVTGICHDYRGDIRDRTAMRAVLDAAQPEIVFHLAAQAIVARGYTDPLNTLSTNVIGTATLLEEVRSYGGVSTVVVVTTDKVYRDTGGDDAYDESDPLGGNDPYGASKACTEIITECYRDRYLRPLGTRMASVRAGNVIGGGDWGQARLIPDIIRAWRSNEPVIVRNPAYVRPWQYVLDVLTGYLVLAERLDQGRAPEGAYNFGPRDGESAEVARIVSRAVDLLDIERVELGATANGGEVVHLRINPTKVRDVLGFANILGVDEAVDETLRWYRVAVQAKDQLALCRQFIRDYCARFGLAAQREDHLG
ncbi:CDP-glucose 4,6-dehydratase [Micromonospora saelicesensis]|uniref:CDP-glucose 4,6-dehydratase n=1 Tax=Micromonospora saelicesensis TaxID=285676 RepID=UPI003CFAE74D